MLKLIMAVVVLATTGCATSRHMTTQIVVEVVPKIEQPVEVTVGLKTTIESWR